MTTVPFAKALNFFAYEFGLKMLGVTNSPTLSPVYNFVAGFWSGLPISFIVSPSELIKCRLQMEGIGGGSDKSKGLQMMKNIVATEGIGGLYRGLALTMSREMPSYAFYFGSFQYSRKFLTERFGESRLNTFLAGCIGGAMSWITVYPIDVIKTQLQTQPGHTRQIINDIWNKQGIRGFFSGLMPCLIRAFIVAGFTFVPYEESKKILAKIIH